MRYFALLLLLVISLGPSQAAGATPKQIINQLRSAQEKTVEGSATDEFLQQLTGVIIEAYQGVPRSEIRKRLDFALITSTQLSDRPRVYAFYSDEEHSAASTTKIVLLARLMTELEASGTGGRWGLDGVDFGPVTRRMIGASDNAAANTVVDYFGLDEVNDWLRTLGLQSNEMRFERHFSGNPPLGKDNYATAIGLARFYFLLAQEQDIDGFLKRGSLAKARSLLDSNGDCNNVALYNDRLNAQFPAGVRFIHKTGSNERVIGDGGIVVDGSHEFILVVFDTGKDRAAMQRLGLGVLELMRSHR